MQWLQPLFDFLTKMLERSGAKSIIALGGITGICGLTWKAELDPIWGGSFVIAIVFGYFISRVIETKSGGVK